MRAGVDAAETPETQSLVHALFRSALMLSAVLGVVVGDVEHRLGALVAGVALAVVAVAVLLLDAPL